MQELTPRAINEITRTFNSLTSSTVTVEEYVAYLTPDGVWAGDACGCTDSRCIGHHHDADDPCPCLDVQLDQFHDDLSVLFAIRQWLAGTDNKELAAAALETLTADEAPTVDADPSHTAVLESLYQSTSHLDPADFRDAVRRAGLTAIR